MCVRRKKERRKKKRRVKRKRGTNGVEKAFDLNIYLVLNKEILLMLMMSITGFCILTFSTNNKSLSISYSFLKITLGT